MIRGAFRGCGRDDNAVTSPTPKASSCPLCKLWVIKSQSHTWGQRHAWMEQTTVRPYITLGLSTYSRLDTVRVKIFIERTCWIVLCRKDAHWFLLLCSGDYLSSKSHSDQAHGETHPVTDNVSCSPQRWSPNDSLALQQLRWWEGVKWGQAQGSTHGSFCVEDL